MAIRSCHIAARVVRSDRAYTPHFVSDFPIDLPGDIVERYARAFDVEERIPRALDALGHLAGRDVLLLDTPIDGLRASQIRAREGRVAAAVDPSALDSASVDVVAGLWSALREPGSPDEQAAMRVARPGGRILVLRDYGRDDIHTLSDTAGRSEPSTSPKEREAPFLSEGWKVRVIHCYWTFDSLDEARAFALAFGEAGRTVAETMRRPRLSHNVAVFHRTVPT